MSVKGGTPRTIVVEGRELTPVEHKRFSFRRYSNKLYLRIGSLIIEAGWYEGEPVSCGIKALEWFEGCGEVVIIHVQIIKAILCVSWDYGR